MVSKCYQKNKEALLKEASERYQNLYEEEKEKRCQCHRDWDKNLSGKEKQKEVEYMRNYI